MGLAGFLSAPFQNALSKDNKGRALIYSTIGATLAVFVRYFWHYVAGFIFWGATHQKACHLTFIRSVSMVQLDC